MQQPEPARLTVAVSQRTIRAGAGPRSLLQARHARLAGGGAAKAAWIHLISGSEVEARLQQLDALAKRVPDRAAGSPRIHFSACLSQ